jgi:hypothetical protein
MAENRLIVLKIAFRNSDGSWGFRPNSYHWDTAEAHDTLAAVTERYKTTGRVIVEVHMRDVPQWETNKLVEQGIVHRHQ